MASSVHVLLRPFRLRRTQVDGRGHPKARPVVLLWKAISIRAKRPWEGRGAAKRANVAAAPSPDIADVARDMEPGLDISDLNRFIYS